MMEYGKMRDKGEREHASSVCMQYAVANVIKWGGLTASKGSEVVRAWFAALPKANGREGRECVQSSGGC